MAIVSNTSPLNYLVLIDLADLLPALFTNVVVPGAVLDELNVEAAPEKVRAWSSSPPSWVEVRHVEVPPEDSLMRLHPGEREAIMLAQTIGAPLLVDELEAREEAKRPSVVVTGTLRVLDEAAERGLADFSAALSKLQKTTFFVSQKLLKAMMERDQERKRQKGRQR